jgi:predicted permease
MIARLRPGVASEVAEQQMTTLFLGVGPSMVRDGELRVRLVDARLGASDSRTPLTRPLLIALVLASGLLLVSCANTGGLLLARFASRQGEFGLRIAIGASRSRLIRQLTIEAVLLAAIAGGAGLLVAVIAAPLVLQMVPAGSAPPGFDLRFDWRLAAFTAVLTAAAAAVAGAVSLSRVTRAEPARLLNANARTVVVGSRRMTRLLITAQVSLSLLLVVGAAAMTRSVINLRNVDPGFDPGDTVAIRVDATNRTAAPGAHVTYHQQLLQRIAAAPHVARATVAQVGLMSGAATTGTVDILNFVPRTDEDRWVRLFWVGPDFFETVGMRVMLGRGLERQDATSAQRVAVVNDRFARFYFGSADEALGRIVNRDVLVVGVVADARYDTLRAEPARALFVPFTQAPPRAAMTFIVRPEGERTRAVQAAISAIRAHDPQLRPEVTAVSDQIASTLAREHFTATIAAILSCFGVFLSCAGLYAAVTYATSERRGEFAVRMTLGATARDIVTLVLREPLRTTLTGIAAGLPGAYALMHGASSLLYGIAPFDLVTVAIGCVLLTTAAVGAALWPALRAGRTEPIMALRAQ